MSSVQTEHKHVLIGTAGHIDHGKTRLILRLTGVDTDRLPEEKSRGISIDLGFAHWESGGYQFGIVDVPGHERFVKNMVAGATGVNVALLVVAADDGVMPQTREHLEIMDLLGLTTGVVAITKTDLVEPDFVELVRAEVEDLVAGTFLEGRPVIPVSSATGEGIEELKAALTRVAGEVEWPESRDLFRMPIDRVFSIAGHGTVATGSVLSGEVHAGDTLELLPEQRDVRVRSVQHHGTQAEEGGARQRTAVNLAGVKTEELHRGMELATPGYLQPTRRLVVDLRCLASSPIVLKDRLELNLHLGTSETPVRVILKGRPLKPGGRATAELRLQQPVVAVYGQPFILRRISPALTVGGGKVLDPYVPPHKRIKDLQDYGAALAKPADIERLSFLLSQEDIVGDSLRESPARGASGPHWAADNSAFKTAWRVGISLTRHGELTEELKARGALTPLGSAERPLLVHRRRLNAVSRSVLRTIHAELARHQPRRALPRNTLITACRGITRPELLDAVFDHLLQTGELVRVGSNIGPADVQVKLTKNQEQIRAGILQAVADGGLTPPTIKELTDVVKQPQEQVEPLLNLCVEDGLLVKISENLFFAPEALEQARSLCENFLNETPEATMSQLREAWGVSRKFAVPLCEYLDEQDVTVRQGDVRVPGPKLAQPLVTNDQ